MSEKLIEFLKEKATESLLDPEYSSNLNAAVWEHGELVKCHAGISEGASRRQLALSFIHKIGDRYIKTYMIGDFNSHNAAFYTVDRKEVERVEVTTYEYKPVEG